jgi:hypothetical protein
MYIAFCLFHTNGINKAYKSVPIQVISSYFEFCLYHTNTARCIGLLSGLFCLTKYELHGKSFFVMFSPERSDLQLFLTLDN